MSTASLQTDERRQIRFEDLESQAMFWLVSFALYGVMIANHTHIETNDHVKFAGGLELFARLAASGIAGLIGIYGCLFNAQVRKAFCYFPCIWLLAILGMHVVGTFFSPDFKFSAAHLTTLLCVAFFAPTALAVLGTRQTVKVMVLAMLTTVVASWFLYLFAPAYGVMIEITDATGASVERMGGTSHPNVLAGTSVLLFVTICYLWFERKMGTFVAVPLILFCILTLVMTGTRVAMISGVLSVLLVYRGFWLNREILPFTILFIALGLAGFGLILGGAVQSDAATSLTRSGDFDEITSVTGRSDIWVHVVELIGERPLRGYGPGTAKTLLAKKDMLLHPHNLLLHMAINGGVVCAFFALMMLINQFFISLTGKYKLAALISFVIMLNSFTEIPIFDYVPGAPTVMWMVAIFWPFLDDGTL